MDVLESLLVLKHRLALLTEGRAGRASPERRPEEAEELAQTVQQLHDLLVVREALPRESSTTAFAPDFDFSDPALLRYLGMLASFQPALLEDPSSTMVLYSLCDMLKPSEGSGAGAGADAAGDAADAGAEDGALREWAASNLANLLCGNAHPADADSSLAPLDDFLAEHGETATSVAREECLVMEESIAALGISRADTSGALASAVAQLQKALLRSVSDEDAPPLNPASLSAAQIAVLLQEGALELNVPSLVDPLVLCEALSTAPALWQLCDFLWRSADAAHADALPPILFALERRLLDSVEHPSGGGEDGEGALCAYLLALRSLHRRPRWGGLGPDDGAPKGEKGGPAGDGHPGGAGRGDGGEGAPEEPWGGGHFDGDGGPSTGVGGHLGGGEAGEAGDGDGSKDSGDAGGPGGGGPPVGPRPYPVGLPLDAAGARAWARISGGPSRCLLGAPLMDGLCDALEGAAEGRSLLCVLSRLDIFLAAVALCAADDGGGASGGASGEVSGEAARASAARLLRLYPFRPEGAPEGASLRRLAADRADPSASLLQVYFGALALAASLLEDGAERAGPSWQRLRRSPIALLALRDLSEARVSPALQDLRGRAERLCAALREGAEPSREGERGGGEGLAALIAGDAGGAAPRKRRRGA